MKIYLYFVILIKPVFQHQVLVLLIQSIPSYHSLALGGKNGYTE